MTVHNLINLKTPPAPRPPPGPGAAARLGPRPRPTGTRRPGRRPDRTALSDASYRRHTVLPGTLPDWRSSPGWPSANSRLMDSQVARRDLARKPAKGWHEIPYALS